MHLCNAVSLNTFGDYFLLSRLPNYRYFPNLLSFFEQNARHVDKFIVQKEQSSFRVLSGLNLFAKLAEF